VVYARDEIPAALVEQIAARRPGLDPRELVPLGLAAARARLKEFIAVGVSKFVIRPALEPACWRDELEELAGEVLPLQD
jgi:hypothetical protein